MLTDQDRYLLRSIVTLVSEVVYEAEREAWRAQNERLAAARALIVRDPVTGRAIPGSSCRRRRT